MPCYQLALVLLSWWWWWEGSKLQIPLSWESDVRYSLQNSVRAHSGILGIKLTSGGCPIGKDTGHKDVTVALFIGIWLYRCTSKSHNEFQWSWAWVMKSFATFYPIVSQFSRIKNSWRYSFTSFFPAIFVLTPKWFMVLIIFWRDLSWPRI